LVAEDGFFGVEQTSERIFQFALGLAGNDPAKFEKFSGGSKTGFRKLKKSGVEPFPKFPIRPETPLWIRSIAGKKASAMNGSSRIAWRKGKGVYSTLGIDTTEMRPLKIYLRKESLSI
jgi:hypothetical protein